jgi:hypothetical protein
MTVCQVSDRCLLCRGRMRPGRVHVHVGEARFTHERGRSPWSRFMPRGLLRVLQPLQGRFGTAGGVHKDCWSRAQALFGAEPA